jgi:hypothetical protein
MGERFKGGWRSFDDARCGRPLAVTLVEVKDKINQSIRYNRRIRTNEFTSEMRIFRGWKWCKNGLRPNGSILSWWIGKNKTCGPLDKVH